MKETIRMQRLEQIAKQDSIYQVWEKSYYDFSDKFHKITRWCPKRIRNILCGYAESGRLMMQRMTNLACDHMEFPDENKLKER